MLSRESDFARGVALGLRIMIILVHLSFAGATLPRHNIPLLFRSFQAFDDNVAFWWWGAGSLLSALLLILLPPRLPWGLISTTFSTFLLYLIAVTFQASGGLIPATVFNYVCALVMGGLMTRALWLWLSRVQWFVNWARTHGR